MDAKIFKFYQALKYHEFTEEQMEDVVEGIKVITRDESRDHATKSDIENLRQLIYDKYTAIVLWVVSTGIAITALIIAVTKLL